MYNKTFKNILNPKNARKLYLIQLAGKKMVYLNIFTNNYSKY